MKLDEWLDLFPEASGGAIIFLEDGSHRLLIPRYESDDEILKPHLVDLLLCAILLANGNEDLKEIVADRGELRKG